MVKYINANNYIGTPLGAGRGRTYGEEYVEENT
jgi:hypothetical protein